MSPSVCSKRPKPWALSFSHWPLQTERQKRQKSKKMKLPRNPQSFPSFPTSWDVVRCETNVQHGSTCLHISCKLQGLSTKSTKYASNKTPYRDISSMCSAQAFISSTIGPHLTLRFTKGSLKKTWEIYGACEYAENTKHDLHCTSSDSSVAMVLDFELIGMLMRKNNARTMQAKEDHEEDSQN